MLFWIVAALLTLAASLAVLLPLTKQSRAHARPQDNDIEVYRDQLLEVQRDAERGLIGPAEAEEARAEIGRRILALADKAPASSQSGSWPVGGDFQLASTRNADSSSVSIAVRVVGAAAVLSIPLVGWGLYAELGSPSLPNEPLSARLSQDPSNSSVEDLVARAEAHLSNNPEDGRGWDVLAPIYLRGGRFDDSAAAYRNAIRILGETGDRLAGLGEALASSANGRVTSEARAAFGRAIEIEPANPKATFYLATGLAQDGKLAEAAGGWNDMIARLPADSPWRAAATQALAEVDQMKSPAPTTPGPTQEQIDAASSMSVTDRNAMIEQMVAGLDAKLRDNPRDAEGWTRLVRSYAVLGRTAAARDALSRGLRALGADTQEGKQLAALGATLGLAATE